MKSTSFFEWKDEFAVGIEELDSEHKIIIQSINDLYVAMQENTSSVCVPELFNVLVDYTIDHFANEQAMMAEVDYPAMEDHLREHKVMRRKVVDMQARHKAGQVGVSVELLLFLRNWLETHIQKTDRALVDYLKAIPQASSS